MDDTVRSEKHFHCSELVDRNGISPQWTLQSGDLSASVVRMERRLLRTGDNTKFMKLNDKLSSVSQRFFHSFMSIDNGLLNGLFYKT